MPVFDVIEHVNKGAASDYAVPVPDQGSHQNKENPDAYL
jgi:hypothetical protein